MTQSDKEHIHKIQISQLVTDDPNADDFYCRMWTAIRQQPPPTLEIGRVGNSSGRGSRQDQSLARQVQRIVNDARKRTKATQLSLEGALGAIAINSVRTPRQALQIAESTPSVNELEEEHSFTHFPQHFSVNPQVQQAQDRKRILKIIEHIYDRVLGLEQLVRQKPTFSKANTERESRELLERWNLEFVAMAAELWQELRVSEPLGTK